MRRIVLALGAPLLMGGSAHGFGPGVRAARRIISALVVLGVVLSIGSPAWAGYKAGLRAYRAKDYATALHEFRPAADRGNVHAQYRLGQMYERGQGVSVDTQTALKWYGASCPGGSRQSDA